MGWVPGSDQPRRYLRLAEQDLEDSLKSKSRNWEGDEKREEDCFYFEPVKCRSCGCFNKFEASNCKDCGTVLSASR
ncbi:MAG: hypothetical protein SVV03_02265, partial [Candidatus Nanohaloarchaea archaeon]|nr:hypothetical protein [Candidatus Nanohaloarchaea archaeon]